MTAPRTFLAVSVTREEAARLTAGGPRRDFVELARATGATIVYRDAPSGGGWRAKLLGPHVRQAWRLAARLRRGDRAFADGEHIGLPLVLFLVLRRRRPARVVMLGHLVTRPWKLPLLWLASRMGIPGTLILHSVEQRQRARSWLGPAWRLELMPYQVDTAYWNPAPAVPGPRPLIVAVGSENRDYAPLMQAAKDLDAGVVVAAGSHWARSTAGSGFRPENVEYLDKPLAFPDLRELYRRAAVVVVPLHDVANQSGVTTLLEAMSCAIPVVVTATRGQREIVTGPLVLGDGTTDPAATADRGPQAFGANHASRAVTGLYVVPNDARSLRAAIDELLRDPVTAAALGAAGRDSALQRFTIEQYVANLAALLIDTDPGTARTAPEAAA